MNRISDAPNLVNLTISPSAFANVKDVSLSSTL